MGRPNDLTDPSPLGGTVTLFATVSTTDGFVLLYGKGFNNATPGDPLTDFGMTLGSGPGGLQVDSNEIFPGWDNSIAGAAGPSVYSAPVLAHRGLPVWTICCVYEFSGWLHGDGLSTAGINFDDGLDHDVVVEVSDRNGGTIRVGDAVAENVGLGPWFIRTYLKSHAQLVWSADGESFAGSIHSEFPPDFSGYIQSIEVRVDGAGEYHRARFDDLRYKFFPEPATISIVAIGLLALGRTRQRTCIFRV